MKPSEIDLRLFNAASLEQYRELITDPAVTKHMPLAMSYYTDEWIRNWVISKSNTWSDESLGPWSIWIDGQFAGWAGLEPDGNDLSLGIVTHKRFWGLGREIVVRVLNKWPKNLNVNRVVIEFPISRKSGQWASRLPITLIGEIEIEGQVFEKYELDLEKVKS